MTQTVYTPQAVEQVKAYAAQYERILDEPEIDLDPARKADFEDLLADARAWLREAGHAC